ncbi:DNA polymerase-3 subunit gamma/tau [Acetitomaculum ruminis DSM 5522]|uniref:DNA-directed DNA polymerase n=1 Tax=Acetitomaculum ruminis DSM 5522 TaxID=1120918 RepID=A0A1I0YD36_9FIRM|nr:DNA polymerase III subunit gamma/tau [Acetitomaculum ruminis]SFB11062.1 DNA polymerase-3 subunit gamma/tau [Acetitomaculum ruminis DSM 5522]
MSYVALYRKFRPKVFEDVKGQEHIVRTLKNQLKTDRIGHAYLFCGTRGTGKTTIAKIFARLVNCENPVDASPCNQCPSCKAALSGSSMNIIEIDAASNNGVENIRSIKEEIAYAPTQGKYRVYIIDEVHMLSTGAFNALLKTLEEPPSYVIFILATTESQKIPATILSRCQRYDFKRIDIATIAARLLELCNSEGVEIEERAVNYIARKADGSMRDAISLLDQCTSFYMGQLITYDDALEVLGAVDTEVYSRLLNAILKEEVSISMEIVNEIVLKGKEILQFVNEFTWYLRNLMLIKTAPGIEDVIDVSTENLQSLKQESEFIKYDKLMELITEFSRVASNLKNTTQKRIILEMTIIKVSVPFMRTDSLAALNDRIQKLEEDIKNGKISIGAQAPPIQPVEKKLEESIHKQEDSLEETLDESKADHDFVKTKVSLDSVINNIYQNWEQITRKINSPTVRGHLRNANLGTDDMERLVLYYNDDYNYGFINRSEPKEMLKNALKDFCGQDIEIVVKKANVQQSDLLEERIEQLINETIQYDD